MNRPAVISLERRAIALLLAALFGVFAAVGCGALFAPSSPLSWPALLPLAAALLLSPRLARRLPAQFDGISNGRRLLSALWLLLALTALARTAGLGVYMADPQRPQASAIWFDPFYVNHSCLSGYWKASELSKADGVNVYDDAPYDGNEGRFKLDTYLYPPQFLLLPRAIGTLGGGFLQLRALWFALDGALLAGAMLALCGWIGGQAGRRAALLLPAAWLGLPTLITLQTGNFQLPALALSVLAMLLFQRGRDAAGGALLGIAVVKIFPGILFAYLLFGRRWRALGWSVAWSLACAGLGLALLGAAPFRDFAAFELPRIASGELWSWLALDGLEGVAAINDSVPGLVFKLRLLGLAGMDHHMMAAAAWVWSFLLVAIAAVAARRAQGAPHLRQAAIWISLLGLAALRSPFVPDDYGLFPALWLWCLLAASAAATPARIAGLAVLWLAFALVMPFSLAGPGRLPLLLAVSTASQLLALGAWLWASLRPRDGAAHDRSVQRRPAASPDASAPAMAQLRSDSFQ
ncbi:DUF2029 domain-containing protein [Rugamonas sp. FT82W]|uniref:DUF2029 domain-containing protein n=1 Tax=Duganella vulcania TaxID=2692166 RepID=A0A845GDJ4_9BURK|nr:glycosyltransferase family 87 protein [Duganella vulcania]MYM91630.1 DUF2029 domain-containing protein [Duganella vulcania]